MVYTSHSTVGFVSMEGSSGVSKCSRHRLQSAGSVGGMDVSSGLMMVLIRCENRNLNLNFKVMREICNLPRILRWKKTSRGNLRNLRRNTVVSVKFTIRTGPA